MEEIQLWSQMFFEDGSVTQGMRINADIFDQNISEFISVAKKLLDSVNRKKGLLVVWGNGNMFYKYYDFVTEKIFNDMESSE